MESREAVTLENQGKKIFGILHRPLIQGAKGPAIVICPGFGGNKSGKYRVFVQMAEELANQGMTVLRFDYRGSGDSEGEFSDITIESQVSDALVCLNFLSNDPKIDKMRIGVLGRSLGGMISVIASSRHQGVKSMALWAPVFTTNQWKKMWSVLSIAPQALIKKGIAKLLPNIPGVPSMEFLKQFFQINLQTELHQLNHVPLLHIHGTQDEVVKIDHASAYQQFLGTNGSSRFIQLPKSNHDFSDENERQIAMKETCQWFINTL